MEPQAGTTPLGGVTGVMPGPVVSLVEVRKTYESMTGAVDAVSDVSFDVRAGEFVSLIGPSGCGKSTILKIIAGLIGQDHGAVTVHGEVARPGRREVGLMFQAPVLLPWRNIRQNILLPFEIFGEPIDDAIDGRSAQLLEMVGLAGFGDKHPWELSGGMRQRAALARLLITQPTVLLMDEPLAALDELTRERLVFELSGLCERIGATALYVTHNIAEAVILSDRVLVMSHHPGTILASVDVPLTRPRRVELVGSVKFAEIGQEIRQVLATADAGTGVNGGRR
jgi:NitT/TauT family transport system ATP-binding protein